MKPQHLGVIVIIVAALGLIILSDNPGGSDVGDVSGELIAIPEPPEFDLPSVFSLTDFVERHEGLDVERRV